MGGANRSVNQTRSCLQASRRTDEHAIVDRKCRDIPIRDRAHHLSMRLPECRSAAWRLDDNRLSVLTAPSSHAIINNSTYVRYSPTFRTSAASTTASSGHSQSVSGVKFAPARAAETSVFFQELVIGAEFAGPGRTLTDADLSIACMVSGDWHPIHADEAYAKSLGLRGRLFHGAFGLFIATGLATKLPHFSDEVVGATGIKEWVYRLPLFVGDTIHVRTKVLSKRMTSDGRRAIVERSLSLVNDRSEIVQEGIAGTMLRVAPRGPTDPL
jgi:acyl dehydratase